MPVGILHNDNIYLTASGMKSDANKPLPYCVSFAFAWR